MKYNAKSIKTILTAHQTQLFALCNSKAQFAELQAYVNNILNSKDLIGNESVEEAKVIFKNCSKNYGRYVSTLMTYLTGIKVSYYNN